MSVENPATEPALQPWDSPHHLMAWSFAEARRRRREHYAGRARPSRPRSRAIITMVHNERVFLPIWLRYYSRFFAPSDIYVLDNETTDGSTKRDGFVRIPVAHETVDHTWMVRTIEELQHDLLDRYDVVVVTDVDEIIAPVPETNSLATYLDWFDEEFVNCLGYELLHIQPEEPPLRLDDPVLDQRRYWFFNGGYDKPAVATVPMRWRPGFHGREDFSYNLDPDLRLVHLHRMDYGLCLERHRTRSRRPWAELDAREGWAVHNRFVEEPRFRHWFYEDSGFSGFDAYRIEVEEIQPLWRGLF